MSIVLFIYFPKYLDSSKTINTTKLFTTFCRYVVLNNSHFYFELLALSVVKYVSELLFTQTKIRIGNLSFF